MKLKGQQLVDKAAAAMMPVPEKSNWDTHKSAGR